MNLPEPTAKTYRTLINDIELGQIKIPQFQRDFVWDPKKSAKLLDSIIKGYPIGTFIFWRTKERLRTIRNIGNIDLPEPTEGEYVDYVLDGQQRITSLFAIIKGLSIDRDPREIDYSNIFVDLEACEEDDIVVFDTDQLPQGSFIRIMDLLSGGLTLLAGFNSRYHKRIEDYKQRIESYSYSVIQIKEAPIDTATEIFTRINVSGKPLSLFEIMVAKTYDSEKNFDLSEKYQQLIDRLRPLDYETISDAIVLQVVSILLEKDCTRKQILRLKKEAFIQIWDSAVDAIERSVEYFRNTFRIPVSRLLPYNALLVPFSYFFYNHKDKPTGERKRRLEDFFWRISLTGRYSSGVENKLANDVKKVDSILKDENVSYEWSLNVNYELIEENGWFNAGSSFIKSILFLYAYKQPKSFNDKSLVHISNYWLKQANSKNYHHFFPKAYLQKKNENYFYVNHIANITIVDDFLNKRQIKASPPSVYMGKFNKSNVVLSETMRTHLIDDLDKFGVWTDDYDVFFKMRINSIVKELRKRIIPQEIDSSTNTIVHQDFYNSELIE